MREEEGRRKEERRKEEGRGKEAIEKEKKPGDREEDIQARQTEKG